jgi:hypothetical protein
MEYGLKRIDPCHPCIFMNEFKLGMMKVFFDKKTWKGKLKNLRKVSNK